MKTHDFTQIINNFQHIVRNHKQYVQTVLNKIENTESIIQNLSKDFRMYDSKLDGQSTTIFALANGKLFSLDKLSKEKKNGFINFDVVWDQTSNKFYARQDPEKHTPLRECSSNNIGPTRMNILQYLLGHLGSPLGVENLYLVGQDFELMEPNALAQTICQLRQMLQPGTKSSSYIITEKSWNMGISRTGRAYIANPHWNYLIIKQTSQKS